MVVVWVCGVEDGIFEVVEYVIFFVCWGWCGWFVVEYVVCFGCDVVICRCGGYCGGVVVEFFVG